MIEHIFRYEKILELLNDFTPYFTSLRTGSVNTIDLAKKLHLYGTVIQIRENDKTVGFAAFYHNDTVNNYAYLSLIAISSFFEGKGYGSILLSEVERISLESGMRAIKLQVYKSNSHALAFYIRHGYIVTGNDSDVLLNMMKALL